MSRKHNFKRPNHEVKTEFVQEIQETKQYVVPIDTSVIGLLQRSTTKEFTPNYSGDIMDMSNASLMEINSAYQNAVQNTEYLKAEADSYKESEPTPEPTPEPTIQPEN